MVKDMFFWIRTPAFVYLYSEKVLTDFSNLNTCRASIRRFLNSIESSLVVEENLNDVKILFILFYVCYRFQKTFLKIRFMIGSVLSRIFDTYSSHVYELLTHI